MNPKIQSGLRLGLALSVALAPVGPSPFLSTAWAQPPALINFQGRLTDSTGSLPLSGTQSITFGIYDAATGGNLKWTETDSVSVNPGGLFTVQLGAGGAPLDPAIFNSLNPLYLQVTVGSDSLTPRKQLVTSPFAFESANSDSLGGTPAALYVTHDASGNVTISGALNMSNRQINNVGSPTAGGDAANKAYVDQSSATLGAEITAETGRAQGAEAVLTGSISAETSRAQSAEATLTTNLTAETNRATGAEGTLTTNLNNEVSRAKGAEQTLATNLTAETNRATTAEGALTTSLTQGLAVKVSKSGDSMSGALVLNGTPLALAAAGGDVLIGSGDGTSNPAGGLIRAPNVAGVNDRGGANLTLAAGDGTGNGYGGSIVFKVPQPGPNGTTPENFESLTLSPIHTDGRYGFFDQWGNRVIGFQNGNFAIGYGGKAYFAGFDGVIGTMYGQPWAAPNLTFGQNSAGGSNLLAMNVSDLTAQQSEYSFSTSRVADQVNSPSIAFTGSVFRVATGSNASSRAEHFRVDGSGNVGIGSATPGARLDVAGGSVRSDTGFCIGASCISAWPSGGGGSSEWTTSGSNIYNANAGSVTIGQQSAFSGNNSRNLDVLDEIKSFGAGAGFRMEDRAAPSDTTKEWVSYANGGVYRVWNNYSDLMTLNQGGSLSLASTITGANQLTLNRAVGGSDPSADQHILQLEINNGLGVYGTRAMGIGVLDNGVGEIQVKEANVGYNTLLLNPVAGNVGVGTGSPQARLDVEGGLLSQAGNSGGNWFPYTDGNIYMRSPNDYVTNTIKAENGSWSINNSGGISSAKWGLRLQARQVAGSSCSWGCATAGTFSFSSNGGTLLINVEGTGMGNQQNVLMSMNVDIDGGHAGGATVWVNDGPNHHDIDIVGLYVGGIAAGSHTIAIKNGDNMNTDTNDRFSISVMELPW